MTKIEKQIRAVLDHAMCECPVGPGLFVYLIECPTCLTKRIAAAIEADRMDASREYHEAQSAGCDSDGAFDCVCERGYTAALRALKGEP